MIQSSSPYRSGVHVRTLGRLSVELASEELQAIVRQPKRFALLTYIAFTARDGFCRRDKLVAVFWPELDRNRARGAMRNALHFLRKALGPDVLQAAGTEAIRIGPEKLWCDAVAFDDAVRSEHFEEAMRLYEGDFMEGFHLNGGTQFDEWRNGMERSLRRQAMEAALQLVHRAEQASDAGAAVAWARKATELARYDDEPVQRLIALLRRMGKPAAALEAYEGFKERMAELELEPALPTVQLVTELRRAQSLGPGAARTPANRSGITPPSMCAPNNEGAARTVARSVAENRDIPNQSGWFRKMAGALGVAAMLAATASVTQSWLERRWARSTGFQELRDHVEQQDFVGAYSLARRLAPSLEGNPEFEALWIQMTFPTSVRTTPDSAAVFIKDYDRPEDEWIPLGIAPLDSVHVPATYLRWRIEHPRTGSQERAALDSYLRSEVHFHLQPEGRHPGMIQVTGDALNLAAPRAMPLRPYWLDRYEVTNRDYARFVDAGGYENRHLWPDAFEGDDRRLSFDGGMRLLTDRSGHPGPSAWIAGAYPSDAGDLPVAGVSWYEAAAYCKWSGKELPTLYHWYGAGGYHGFSSILTLSNFSAGGPAPVGQHVGIGPYGHYDLAGNVREWVSNATDSLRLILGGAWDSPRYLFWTPDAAPPMDRSLRNGFRCAVLDEPADHRSRAAPQFRSRDLAHTPVADGEFEMYRALYAYDHSRLNPVVDSVSEAMPHWRREFVSFDAVYGGETVHAQLFVPKHAEPPYSTVIFFPGADAANLSSSALLHTWWFDFIVRSGRAVMYPVYKGTYERRVPLTGPKDFRDQLVQRAKDLQRSVDYLAARSDIDADRIAYYGFSEGGSFAPIFSTIENRIVTSVVLSGGLFRGRLEPLIEPANFLPRARTPLLMIGGDMDFIFPVTSSQRPFFDAWAAPAEHKRFVAIPHGHAPTEMREVASEVLDWLDRYLGPAGTDTKTSASRGEILGSR